MLLLFAFGINAFELCQIQLSTIQILTWDLMTYWAPITIAALVLHFILRMKASEADSLILPAAVLLNGLGLAEIYRLDLATLAAGGSEVFGLKQVIWTVVAIAAASAPEVLDDLTDLPDEPVRAACTWTVARTAERNCTC
jgi:hypothetical protein